MCVCVYIYIYICVCVYIYMFIRSYSIQTKTCNDNTLSFFIKINVITKYPLHCIVSLAMWTFVYFLHVNFAVMRNEGTQH